MKILVVMQRTILALAVCSATLSLPELGQAHRGAQLQGLCLMTAGDGNGLAETSFGIREFFGEW